MSTKNTLYVVSLLMTFLGSATGWLTMLWLKKFNNIVLPSSSVDILDYSLNWEFALYKIPALIFIFPTVHAVFLAVSSYRANMYTMILFPFLSLFAPLATIALLYCN